MPVAQVRQNNENHRFSEIRKVLWVVLLLNWAVASAKLFYGWTTNSASITADGYHSFSDGASNIVGLFGIWLASKPRDEDHPYGHSKYESLTTVGISMLLFLACFRISCSIPAASCLPVSLNLPVKM